jgi:hypothetical protein
MIELFKLVWNLTVLRDSIDKGEMTAGVWAGAALFLLVVASIGVPTVVYYDRHPDASARVMTVAAVLLGLVLIVYFWLAIRWRMRLARERPEQK